MRDLHPSVREIAVLQEATEMILASMDVDTVLHQILLIVRNYFGAKHCSVFLADHSTGELLLRAENGYRDAPKNSRYKLGEQGVIPWVAQSKTPLYLPDVTRDARYVQEDALVRSQLALPLMAREEIVGVLNVESDKLDSLTDEMIGLLALFAGQAAVALENARLYSTERRRMRQIELVSLIARSATSAGDLNLFLNTLAELIADTFDGSEVTILLRDDAGKLALRAHAGSQYPLPEALQASERRGIIAQALSARTSCQVDDLSTRMDWAGVISGEGSELCVPLNSFSDLLGLIVIAHPKPHAFTAEDRSIAQASADVCATAVKNVHLSDELKRVSNTDSLTGLYNQRYFHAAVGQEVSRSQRYNKRFSILLFDLRNFRRVNDALGFHQGDEVLKQVAHALGSQVRAIDTLCRFAADRFAVLLPETTAEHIPPVSAKVEELLAGITYLEKSGPAPLSAISAHVNYPEDGATEAELLERLTQRVTAARRPSNAAGAN